MYIWWIWPGPLIGVWSWSATGPIQSIVLIFLLCCLWDFLQSYLSYLWIWSFWPRVWLSLPPIIPNLWFAFDISSLRHWSLYNHPPLIWSYQSCWASQYVVIKTSFDRTCLAFGHGCFCQESGWACHRSYKAFDLHLTYLVCATDQYTTIHRRSDSIAHIDLPNMVASRLALIAPVFALSVIYSVNAAETYMTSHWWH